ncbi:MAG: type II secretion system protein GspK [Deltaproteobacteria bacterium]|nr:type II secretion system protein GspK [Deltaproteobacteria bacterium]
MEKNNNFGVANAPLGKRRYFLPDLDEKGVVLIMVLWIIAILSVIAFEFSYAMRTEVKIVRNFQEELQLYALAEGGVERSIAELVYKHDPRVQMKRKALKSEEFPPEKKEWVTDGRDYRLTFDPGVCSVKILGEAGKMNINLVSGILLSKIITNLGVEGEARDILVDSLLDWRDPDDLYRLNGAENDYYQSLPEPYECKNGNLDSIEELLLVRGVTPELFYGKKGTLPEGEEDEKTNRIGLKDIFSIYALGEQVDINSATLPVLRFSLGLPSEMARAIIRARKEKVFENQQDLLQRVPELGPFWGEIGRLILFQSTNPFYTIEAKAQSKNGKSIRGLKVIVKIDRREKERYKIIQWLDAFVS